MRPRAICNAPVILTALALASAAQAETGRLELLGIAVTPHVVADSMRYRRDPEPAVGARVQMFLHYEGAADADPLVMDEAFRALFNGKAPAELLRSRAWAWHETLPAAPEDEMALPAGGLTVWTFNSRTAEFGPGQSVRVEFGPENRPWLAEEVALAKPTCWLSAVTFLGPDAAVHPDVLVAHVANASDSPVEIRSCRLWLPQYPRSPRVLFAQPPLEALQPFSGHAVVPPGDRGGFSVRTGQLPLSYAAVEVSLARPDGETFSIWAYLRVKPERFDISGGWVNGEGNPITHEAFLKALKRLHINTAHLQLTPGYSDSELYDRYPLKYFGEMKPIDAYDTDQMLPGIHAVEFLGEPQYGGGRPVPPQEVWARLHPYAATRLATTVTHSEERIWRDYAGLSDYPHYDAYRVTAPSADAWRKYERWGEVRIGWGAPLETIGDMCRSLRELNRPVPCAVWAQGPHDGWDRYDGRERTAPTPDEIRMQVYHAVSTRITSLYWFNLSLKALVMWRDTLDEVGRIGRELRMIDDLLLEGDAYQFERSVHDDRLDWDLASVCGPRAGLLFALDLDYVADPTERVFKFGEPREVEWRFQLPPYLQGVKDVFRIDADGVYDFRWLLRDGAVEVREHASRVAILVATPDPQLRSAMERRRLELVASELALGFDPARNDADFAQLVQLSETLR